MNLLITSIGRRVQLIKHFKERFRVIGIDSSIENAAKEFVDKFYHVHKYDEKEYVGEIIEICVKENIKAIIPLYENEFELLAENRGLFSSLGIKLILSDKEVIETCKSKIKTFKYFKSKKINTPNIYEENNKISKFPLIVKPNDGMGSKNVFIANDYEELYFFSRYVEKSVVQDYIYGDEYTVDVLTDFKGNPVYIVPRLRIEVRAGEVSKSKIVRDNIMIEKTKNILCALNKLGEGIMGPLTIQYIVDEKKDIYLLEINPRLGGGVPLAFKSGANYALALYKILMGEDVKYVTDYNELTMYRYDEAIYK